MSVEKQQVAVVLLERPSSRRRIILRDALKSVEQKGVKINNLVSSRPAHTLWMIVEAETFEAIDEMFEPIRAMTDTVINPVMALPAS